MQLIPVSYSNTICFFLIAVTSHILVQFQNISFNCICQSLRLGGGGGRGEVGGGMWVSGHCHKTPNK